MHDTPVPSTDQSCDPHLAVATARQTTQARQLSKPITMMITFLLYAAIMFDTAMASVALSVPGTPALDVEGVCENEHDPRVAHRYPTFLELRPSVGKREGVDGHNARQ